MSTPIDAVIGYHQTPLTCGVAKFNQMTATRLDVPCLSFMDPDATGFSHPLLSIKLSEFRDADLIVMERFAGDCLSPGGYRLFLHDTCGSELETRLVAQADRVYCGNTQIQRALSDVRDDIVPAWCPGMLDGQGEIQQQQISVLTFGMAKQINRRHYARLKELLDHSGKSYALYLSTAVHEGDDLDQALGLVAGELHPLFGERLYFLGYLSDLAIRHYLDTCTYFAAFFASGVRANNTSVNAAMGRGKPVICNLDEFSPPAFRHEENLLDINRLQHLNHSTTELENMGDAARRVSRDIHGWDRLIQTLRA